MLLTPTNCNTRRRCVTARLSALLLAANFCACAYGQGSADVDRTPITNHGVGASIIYPGQGAPTYQTGGQYGPRGGVIGSGQPTENLGSGPRQVTNGGSGNGGSGGGTTQSGSGAPGGGSGGGSVSFLGGSEQDEVRHESYKNEPYIVKYLALPFALAAAPFKAAIDSVRGAPKPGPAVPRTTQQTSRLPAPSSPHASNHDSGEVPNARTEAPMRYSAPSSEVPRDYESVQLRKMERELDQRQEPPASSSTRSSTPSIADELAALQRRAPAPSGVSRQGAMPEPGTRYANRTLAALPNRQTAPIHAPPETPSAESALFRADGIVDRNSDGRIDQWIFRENGHLVREVLDDDFDGLAERTIHYDVVSNQVMRVEDDFDHDSAIDSWTDYDAGHVIRRRSDLNHDGVVDSWTYYRKGEMSRHERDTDGDGFRDRVGYYRDGALDFEEQDLDGDGRAEVTVRYGTGEQIISREEDLNADGRVDLISHFKNGKLTSRELLDPTAIETTPRR